MAVNRNTYTVIPNHSGTKWTAAGVGGRSFMEEYTSRDVAFAAARIHARGHLPSQVHVYRRDGSIETTRTFGLDEAGT
jgi:hypothetical protein